MRIVAMILLLGGALCIAVLVGVSWARSTTQSSQYLDRQYLKYVKKAQKASRKNKQIAEYYMDEAHRYQTLLQQRNQLRDGVDHFIQRLNGPPK